MLTANGDPVALMVRLEPGGLAGTLAMGTGRPNRDRADRAHPIAQMILLLRALLG